MQTSLSRVDSEWTDRCKCACVTLLVSTLDPLNSRAIFVLIILIVCLASPRSTGCIRCWVKVDHVHFLDVFSCRHAGCRSRRKQRLKQLQKHTFITSPAKDRLHSVKTLLCIYVMQCTDLHRCNTQV